MANTLTQERLKELFVYDPKTGVFTNRITRGHKSLAGAVAGWANSKGYLCIVLNGKRFRLHRLAWLYMTGEWPKDQIDHINGAKADNRFSNLREATNAENHCNVGVIASNASGFKGTYWHKSVRKWVAQIGRDGKQVNLGCFTTREEAAVAYDNAAEEMYGEFAKTNKSMGLL